MLTISERAEQDPNVLAILKDLSVSSRSAAAVIGCGATAVRKWRKNNLSAPYPSSQRMKTRFGSAWTPGVEVGTDDGEIRTIPQNYTPFEPEDAELLRGLDVDPDEWEIVTRRESRWQAPNGEWLRAYKASLKRRGRTHGDLPAEAMNEILRGYHWPTMDISEAISDRTLIVPVGDLQAGKVDGGGSGELIDRFASLTEQVRARMARCGAIRRLILPWLGDCVEGIVSQGGKLALRLDLSVTEQVRLYRRLMLHQIATLAPFADEVIVPVVPGNHDETWRMLNTPVDDSWAIEGASAVADALELSRQYQHVKFLFTDPEELAITLDIGASEPYVLAFTHGHLAAQPGKIIDWWKGQSHGRQAVGRADMLFTGHFHHLRIENTGGNRTWVQIPALDGGSEYYRRKHGEDVPAGMMSMWLTPGEGSGWEGLTVHS